MVEGEGTTRGSPGLGRGRRKSVMIEKVPGPATGRQGIPSTPKLARLFVRPQLPSSHHPPVPFLPLSEGLCWKESEPNSLCLRVSPRQRWSVLSPEIPVSSLSTRDT